MTEQVLRIEIFTEDCEEGQCHSSYEVPLGTDQVDIMKAIQTLYGHLEITEIRMFVWEEDEEEPE